eukprot:1875070-Rhodomonas_salina.1
MSIQFAPPPLPLPPDEPALEGQEGMEFDMPLPLPPDKPALEGQKGMEFNIGQGYQVSPPGVEAVSRPAVFDHLEDLVSQGHQPLVLVRALDALDEAGTSYKVSCEFYVVQSNTCRITSSGLCEVMPKYNNQRVSFRDGVQSSSGQWPMVATSYRYQGKKVAVYCSVPNSDVQICLQVESRAVANIQFVLAYCEAEIWCDGISINILKEINCSSKMVQSALSLMGSVYSSSLVLPLPNWEQDDQYYVRAWIQQEMLYSDCLVTCTCCDFERTE